MPAAVTPKSIHGAVVAESSVPAMTDAKCRVLVLCTANVCRSPVTAMLLDRALLNRGIDAVVESAGFLPGGEPACPTMTDLLADLVWI